MWHKLRDAFSGNVAIFVVYKWCHSDVIVLKLTALLRIIQLNYVQSLYFGFFIFWKSTVLCHFVTYLWTDPRKNEVFSALLLQRNLLYFEIWIHINIYLSRFISVEQTEWCIVKCLLVGTSMWSVLFIICFPVDLMTDLLTTSNDSAVEDRQSCKDIDRKLHPHKSAVYVSCRWWHCRLCG